MYMDGVRSWFFHNDAHHGRVNAGLGTSTVIGVLMDCDRGELTLFRNDQLVGTDVAFR